MATTIEDLEEARQGLAGDAKRPRCDCGSTEFTVVYKAPVRVAVRYGLVVAVATALDCHDGPIVAECDGCGRSDVDGEDQGCVRAREVADAASPWPGIGGRP